MNASAPSSVVASPDIRLKLIAYETGFSMGLTSRILKSAMSKLGLKSAAELAAFVLRAVAMDVPTP